MSWKVREPVLGDTIGPYRLTGTIGRGRMGTVYEAADQEGQLVALKVVTDQLAEDEVFLQRFEREQRAAQRVTHPNVVAVLDHGEHLGRPYLVQRLIRGGSLADRIAQTGQLDLTETLSLAAGIAYGIDALHASGLIHRDIKPPNILLDEEGVPYVSDFGLSKISGERNLTRPGQALGTPHYMAPEQIRGERAVPETDVYALGCVVWECLTGAPPFGAEAGMRVLFAHLHDPVPDLLELRTDLPSAVGRAVKRALEKDPTARPPSAGGYVDRIVRASKATLA